MLALLLALATFGQLQVEPCALVVLEPPMAGAVALIFPPTNAVETKDGKVATVFRQAGRYELYWLYIENGIIRWRQTTVIVGQPDNGPKPPPEPPGPSPQPGPIPKNVSIMWLEESSRRTPQLARLVTELREALEKEGVPFGAVDVDNPVSFIQALVQEVKKQVPGYDPKLGPVLLMFRPGSSQVIAATYVQEGNTVSQLLDWIRRRASRASDAAMGSERASSSYRIGDAPRGATQPVLCPPGGACAISP